MQESKLQEDLKWFPHQGQKDILACDNNEIIIRAGRRWGKSALCGYIVAREFLKALTELKDGDRNSYKVWIVAPTYELTTKVFEYITRFLLAFDKSLGKYISGGTGRPYQLKMTESVWIQCKSVTEPMGLLGEELDLEIIDEAPRIPEKIYHQYIYPTTIAKSRNCRVYVIGSPKGENWFHKMWYRLKDKNAAFHFTTLDGVETDEAKLEEIKKVTPDLLFRQEYMAEFVSDAGTVFKDLDSIIDDTLKDSEPGHFYVMGVDLGRESDYTVMTVINRDTHNVVHIDRLKGIDYPLQKQLIIAKAQRYNNARIIIDATGVGKPIYEDLMRSRVFVEDFTFTGKSKEELMGKLMVFTREKYIRIPNYEPLISEMKAFEFQMYNERTGDPLKNIQYGAPRGYHDDCVDSLALAVWGLYGGKPQIESALVRELKKRRNKKPKSFI